MKILIATGIFPPDIGGPATYSRLVAEAFSGLGHQVTVVTYGEKKVQDACLPVRQARYKIQTVSRGVPKGIRHVVYFWNVLWHGRKTEIIFAQDPMSAGLPALCTAFLLRKRFILKVVGDYAWEQGMQRFGVGDLLDDFLKKRYGFRVEALRFLERFVARSADRVLVPSEYLKRVVIQWGVEREQVFVVYNAVDISPVTIAREEARAQIGLHGFILFAAGRLVPWKGFAMLIRMVPRLQKKIPDVQLIIAGSGPNQMSLELQVRSYKLQDRVQFVGSLPKDRLMLYMKAADVFLLNTGYEGFSHQLIEAMAMGMPIVTTDAGGNKEIIRDGENALVARYNDGDDWEEKVVRLYKNKRLRESLRESNKDIAERYSIEIMIKKTESIVLCAC